MPSAPQGINNCWSHAKKYKGKICIYKEPGEKIDKLQLSDHVTHCFLKLLHKGKKDKKTYIHFLHIT